MKKIVLIAGIAVLTGLASCKKDKGPEPAPPANTGYSVPTTYTFSPMSYSGQTYRLQMLEEMVTYLKTARTSGTTLSATTLKNMFANSGSPFTNTTLNTCGKQLENKCFSLDVNMVKEYMDSIAVTSTNSANIITSTTDGTKKYVLNPYNGYDYSEMIEKTLMGAVFYYHAMETYICANGVGSTVDNTTVVTGEGTAMEHHWDEGFGYLGVPTDFPTNITGVLYWGKYLKDIGVSTKLNNQTTLMNAFIKGRAAISNKDYTTRDAQITIVTAEWEKLIAGSAIHELNEAKANFADNAIRNHVLSEARGFIMCLKYKTNKAITQAQIDAALNTLGNNNNNVTLANINQVIDDIANIYSLTSIKDNL